MSSLGSRTESIQSFCALDMIVRCCQKCKNYTSIVLDTLYTPNFVRIQCANQLKPRKQDDFVVHLCCHLLKQSQWVKSISILVTPLQTGVTRMKHLANS